MKRIILTLLFLLICSTANAEMWVCQEGQTLRRFTGDGYKAGICDKNNKNIIPTCIEATKQEYTDAGLPNKKLNKSIITGNRIVNIPQTEIDERDKPTQTQIDRTKLIKDLENKLKLKGYTSEEINLLLNTSG